ncbi:MAG: hypothetical protein A3J63_00905 [Candidatus Moranbacteria bacterium RIFCSPHIGHO2_02_FULL_40_12b]|nr:MAG: hypothetical protein A3J63_00905 [Candidatus Moranbacteria bacterium RIFCSPHIGHO2_02_FULL_40_12b]
MPGCSSILLTLQSSVAARRPLINHLLFIKLLPQRSCWAEIIISTVDYVEATAPVKLPTRHCPRTGKKSEFSISNFQFSMNFQCFNLSMTKKFENFIIVNWKLFEN